jgi:hypothetical protein
MAEVESDLTRTTRMSTAKSRPPLVGFSVPDKIASLVGLTKVGTLAQNIRYGEERVNSDTARGLSDALSRLDLEVVRPEQVTDDLSKNGGWAGISYPFAFLFIDIHDLGDGRSAYIVKLMMVEMIENPRIPGSKVMATIYSDFSFGEGPAGVVERETESTIRDELISRFAKNLTEAKARE